MNLPALTVTNLSFSGGRAEAVEEEGVRPGGLFGPTPQAETNRLRTKTSKGNFRYFKVIFLQFDDGIPGRTRGMDELSKVL
jgi:hypothetical protein